MNDKRKTASMGTSDPESPIPPTSPSSSTSRSARRAKRSSAEAPAVSCGRSSWPASMACRTTRPCRSSATSSPSVLNNILREDALEQIDKNSDDFYFFENFHKALHDDEQLHSAVESMLSNLEKVKNGQELPPLSYPSRGRIMRDVKRFLEKS